MIKSKMDEIPTVSYNIEISQKIKESYRNLKNDKESIELVELGLEDFNKVYD